jgi:hypothetical protein
MAAYTSTSATINLMLIREKLTHNNHVLWKAQVLAVLRGAQLTSFLDGTNKAPAEKIKMKPRRVQMRNRWKFQIQHMRCGRSKNSKFLATY